MLRCRPVAQNGRWTIRQYGRHPCAAQRGDRVADGVHPTVNAVKPPGAKPPPDRAASEAELLQLPAGHPAVLPVGERGDLTVTWST